MDHDSIKPDVDLIICRCESVTLGRIQDGIHHHGGGTVNEVKKLTRAGMGVCQGKTCHGLIETILNNKSKLLKSEPPQSRPPVRSVNMGHLARKANHYESSEGRPIKAVAVFSLGPENLTLSKTE